MTWEQQKAFYKEYFSEEDLNIYIAKMRLKQLHAQLDREVEAYKRKDEELKRYEAGRLHRIKSKLYDIQTQRFILGEIGVKELNTETEGEKRVQEEINRIMNMPPPRKRHWLFG